MSISKLTSSRLSNSKITKFDLASFFANANSNDTYAKLINKQNTCKSERGYGQAVYDLFAGDRCALPDLAADQQLERADRSLTADNYLTESEFANLETALRKYFKEKYKVSIDLSFSAAARAGTGQQGGYDDALVSRYELVNYLNAYFTNGKFRFMQADQTPLKFIDSCLT